MHTLALLWAWVAGGALPAYSLRSSLDLFSWALVGSHRVHQPPGGGDGPGRPGPRRWPP